MCKFVWEITARGYWAPQLFHGDLPLEITKPHNAPRYVVHDVPCSTMRRADEVAERGASRLEYLSVVFPPPPAFTGKE